MAKLKPERVPTRTSRRIAGLNAQSKAKTVHRQVSGKAEPKANTSKKRAPATTKKPAAKKTVTKGKSSAGVKKSAATSKKAPSKKTPAKKPAASMNKKATAADQWLDNFMKNIPAKHLQTWGQDLSTWGQNQWLSTIMDARGVSGDGDGMSEAIYLTCEATRRARGEPAPSAAAVKKAPAPAVTSKKPGPRERGSQVLRKNRQYRQWLNDVLAKQTKPMGPNQWYAKIMEEIEGIDMHQAIALASEGLDRQQGDPGTGEMWKKPAAGAKKKKSPAKKSPTKKSPSKKSAAGVNKTTKKSPAKKYPAKKPAASKKK